MTRSQVRVLDRAPISNFWVFINHSEGGTKCRLPIFFRAPPKNFSIKEKSIFFTVAGVLLLVLGTFMERARRRMLSTIGDINEVV